MAKKVTFETVFAPIKDSIDEAYQAKYYTNPYLNPMISARACPATVKVMELQEL